MKIEDYGIIGDTQTVALVGRNGSIDWLCVPRFDSAACFAALLGTEDHGCWLIAPDEEIVATRRAYRPGTLILETEFETAGGCVRLDRLHAAAAARRGFAARGAGRARARADENAAHRALRLRLDRAVDSPRRGSSRSGRRAGCAQLLVRRGDARRRVHDGRGVRRERRRNAFLSSCSGIRRTRRPSRAAMRSPRSRTPSSGGASGARRRSAKANGPRPSSARSSRSRR